MLAPENPPGFVRICTHILAGNIAVSCRERSMYRQELNRGQMCE